MDTRPDEGRGGGVAEGRVDPVRWLVQGLLAAYLAPVLLLVLLVGGTLLCVTGVWTAAARLRDRPFPASRATSGPHHAPLTLAWKRHRPAHR